MANPKIYASGNENLSGNFNISYYIIEKDRKFLEWLGDLLVEVLDIEDGKNRAKFVVKNIEGEDRSFIGQEVYAKEIDKMIDLHAHYENKKEGDRVDVFYGKTRVYLTFRKSKESREKFAKFIRKTKEWIKVEKIPELPVYAGKKVEE